MMNYYGMREADGTLFIKQHLAVGPAYNVTVILAWLNENVFKNRKEIGGITGDHAYHGGGAIWQKISSNPWRFPIMCR